ncbi:nucleotidyltransferase domain-containing protein [Tenggerimyces flavus]|uniref:Nucleotidyltransferase domain-containing protein n=1 Tax=Tenggerimyces flavus TaxID=1708749 RepID=A0ABV7YIP9_9ACTN|nr:nucleotidyltransferase domain-containing protein [Tenggerimyces flavus]MBM7787317.1 putative nucleotidyltransferase [Tenggerimyces flavus]
MDPRLSGWRERAASRSREAIEALAAVPGVTGLVLGGSFGRGLHWPLSDLDVMAICSGRPVPEVAQDVDRCAYQLSEMWGSSGIYTAVDAGRLTYGEDEIRQLDGTLDRLADPRWLHGMDKIYDGVAAHDPHGAAQAFLDWSARYRFEPAVVERRIATWFGLADTALARAQTLDPTGAWIALRQVGGALAEVATERWGERTGSFGRAWSLFEDRAERLGGTALADRILTAARARAADVDTATVPEWLADRIALSYEARQLVGENVTEAQSARDNVLAYASLYRGRFPQAQQAWMRSDTDPTEAARELGDLVEELR